MIYEKLLALASVECSNNVFKRALEDDTFRGGVSPQTSIERCYVNGEWCLGNTYNGTEACILNARPLVCLVLEKNGSTFTGYEVGKLNISMATSHRRFTSRNLTFSPDPRVVS